MSGSAGPQQRAQARQAPPRGRRVDRLFFAVYPDAAALRKVQALARQLRAEHGLTGRPISPERSHVTLLFVGSFPGLPDGLVERLKRVGAAVDGAPMQVSFDHVASFDNRPQSRPHNRPLVLLGQGGVQALHGLHQVLRKGLAAAGVATGADSRYTPHLTLLYDDRVLPPQPVPAISWTVGELVLVQSLVGLSTHVHLARWPLKCPGTGD